MAEKKASQKEHIQYHKDGSIWARGQMADESPTGYWEWFRLDGTKMRSGCHSRTFWAARRRHRKSIPPLSR